tara:strand:- start:432 stop:635 length:204 start_codon:yes stop_codon:yes gene_type:complete
MNHYFDASQYELANYIFFANEQKIMESLEYINYKLRIEFETYDCAVGQSFGYAYILSGYLEQPRKSY